MKTDKFRDPIHNFIEIRELELDIINSKPFQRLRNIKQLALTYYIYHGAEHTRFGHSLGVMNLVTKAFNVAINEYNEQFPEAKYKRYEQILRLIALTHDIGHAPFSHASESVFLDGLIHEDYTEKIIKETEIADIIHKIGKAFKDKYGCEYDITPELICDIYLGRDAGPNSEFTFLKSFMDSELDCDKMDYLLRDSYYCGVKYGMFDVDRLINSLTICYTEDTPRLAIKSGGVQAFEEFVLARYFMFIQVYFHRTRRYFDIMLGNALRSILPNGTYPNDINEYLEWDDCKVIQLLKEKANFDKYCGNIIHRIVYPNIKETKTHPQEADKREFRLFCSEVEQEIGKQNLIIDKSAGKMPHKIPMKVEVDDEKAIVIYDKEKGRKTTIAEESEIIHCLCEKIDIQRVYCTPECYEEAHKIVKKFNEV